MSLFRGFEKTGSVFKPTDSNTTKRSSYPSTASFTIDIFIINRTAEGSMLMGDEIGDYIANVRADQTSADTIEKGDKIVVDNKVYFVKNDPKYISLFNKYKMLLAKE